MYNTGMYEAGESAMSLWDLVSDHYLHHTPVLHSPNPYTAWWDQQVWVSTTTTTWELYL